MGYIATPPKSYRIIVSDENAYVLNWPDGLATVSIADPENPHEIAYYRYRVGGLGALNDYTVVGGYAYVANLEWGLSILSLADTENQQEVGFFPMRLVFGVAVSGNFAYVANWENGLQVVSIEDPENPEEMGSLGQLISSEDVEISGDYAYIAESTGLMVVSISNPREPTVVSHLHLGRLAKVLYLVGDHAYVSTRYRGFYVVSIANPERPEIVGYYDTPGSNTDIAVAENGLIYVADGTNLGVYRFNDPNWVNCLDVSAPSKFKLYSAYPNPFNTQTRITYNLPKSTNVKLSILDINGRTVDVLDQGMRTLGQHRLIWDGSGFVSGTYFVRLDAGGLVSNQTTVLLK